MLSSAVYGGTSMDVQQLRKLKPKLGQFLKRFDDCFPRKDTRAHLPVYVSRAALRPPREERRADRPQRRRAGRGPCRSSSASTPGTTTRRATGSSTSSATSTPGPHAIGDLRRDQRRQEGGQDPRRAAAVVRRRRQDRELHRHRPPRRTPATASTACSTASCSCPRAGPTTATAAARPASPTTWSTGPSGRSPWSCTTGPWPTACTSTG